VKHLLSFDFEEWFHIIQNDAAEARPAEWDKLAPRIEEMTSKLLDFLRARNARATFFVLGWVATKYPRLVENLAREGHEIGCHSNLHRPVWSLRPEEFTRDLRASLDAIASAAGKRPRLFRAPGFSIDTRALWAFDAMAKEGIELDSSVFPGLHDHGGIPGAPQGPFRIRTGSGALLREFPISTMSLLGRRITFSGGGYFRILPLRVQKSRFGEFDRAGNPVITYFHPRDFDTQIPPSGLGWVRELKSNINVAGAFAKLSALLGHFEMGTLTEVDAALDWNSRPVFAPEELSRPAG
jgi:polysaccharide deacetylase family protein (PEP-CTERM system associated)